MSHKPTELQVAPVMVGNGEQVASSSWTASRDFVWTGWREKQGAGPRAVTTSYPV